MLQERVRWLACGGACNIAGPSCCATTRTAKEERIVCHGWSTVIHAALRLNATSSPNVKPAMNIFARIVSMKKSYATTAMSLHRVKGGAETVWPDDSLPA